MNNITKSQIIKQAFGKFALNNKAAIIFMLLGLALSLVTDKFLTPTNLLNVIRQICIMGIMSVGFTVVIASGSIDLSVGYMLGLVGVAGAQISKIPGMPLPVSLLLTVILGAGLGFCNAFLFIKFNLPPFIVTLSTAQVFRGLTLLLCKNTPVSGLSKDIIYIGQGYIFGIPVPIIIMLLVTIAIAIFLNHTRIGRHTVAMGGNAQAARVSGINVVKIRYYVYMLMGGCVAIAAIIMNGRVASAQPTAGAGMEMDAIAAVVIGGTPLSGGHGNVVGSVFGCLIVGLINNGLNILNVDSSWQMIAKGALIVIAILLDVQTSKLLSRKKKTL